MTEREEGTQTIGGLRSLKINSLRNLLRVTVETEAPVILLSGGNGAGKTTFLEAVYLLARGRTFRSVKTGPLCARGSERLEVCAEVETLERGRGRIEVARDGAGVHRLADPPSWLDDGAAEMPLRVKLVSENPQSLLDGEPELRRRFLDLGVFHVEPRFARVHAQFRRVLAQRNAALRIGGAGVALWNAPFVSVSNAMHAFRASFVTDWNAMFRELAQGFSFLEACELRYDRGWPETESIEETLKKCGERELQRGFSLAGPGRADFGVTQDGRRQSLSRGQTKVAVTLLQLAAERVHLARGKEPAIFLLDDLESELDETTVRRLWELGCASRSQIIATRVSCRPESVFLASDRDVAMFHVEHGQVRPIS